MLTSGKVTFTGACRVHLARMVPPVMQAPLDPVVTQEKMATRDYLVHQDPLDQLESEVPLEPLEPVVSKVSLVPQVFLGPAVRMVSLVCRVPEVCLVVWGQGVCVASQESEGLRVHQVNLVKEESLVYLVLMVLQVLEVGVDRKVTLVPLAWL